MKTAEEKRYIFRRLCYLAIVAFFFIGCSELFAAGNSPSWLNYRELQKKRIELIAAQITRHLPSEEAEKLSKIKYYVSLEDTINAYAAVGGKVVINKGLLDLIENRDELAFVIAHELGHHALRHHAKGILTTLFGVGVEIGVQALLGQRYGRYMSYASPIVHQPLASMVANAFSQKHENDADEYSFEAMSSAGFNPQVGGEILRKMKEASHNMTMLAMTMGYVATHPPETTRYKNSQSFVVPLNFSIFVSDELDQIEKKIEEIEVEKGIVEKRNQTRLWLKEKAARPKDSVDRKQFEMPEWIKNLGKSKRDDLPQAYRDLGVLAMGLSRKEVNFTFGNLGSIQEDSYHFSDGGVSWFMRMDYGEWGRILSTSLKTDDFRACWYLPDGTLYSEQFFKMSGLKVYTVTTRVDFDPELKDLMIGDWRLMVFEDDQLVDAREFKVVDA